MKKLFIAVFCFTAVFTVEMSAQKTPKWSSFQGKMNWKEAAAKCKKQGMRLPTGAEFKAAYDANLTLDWPRDGAVYWTSEMMSDDAAYVFVVTYGAESNYRKTDSYSVHCIGK